MGFLKKLKKLVKPPSPKKVIGKVMGKVMGQPKSGPARPAAAPIMRKPPTPYVPKNAAVRAAMAKKRP